jgi:hypothetical protein
MHCYLVLCTSSLARRLLLCTQCHDVGDIRTMFLHDSDLLNCYTTPNKKGIGVFIVPSSMVETDVTSANFSQHNTDFFR